MNECERLKNWKEKNIYVNDYMLDQVLGETNRQ